MGSLRRQSQIGRAVWALAGRQHGIITRRQLLDLGVHVKAIDHRLGNGRLHRVRRGVYALGSPDLTREAHWMAAVLYCAPEAYLSHGSAAELWGIAGSQGGLWGISGSPGGARGAAQRDALRRAPALPVHVSLARDVSLRAGGIRLHRPSLLLPEDRSLRDGIPVTSPARTLIDLAAELDGWRLERAVNEADRLGLIDPETLRAAVDRHRRVRGVLALRGLLDRRTFRLTASELERRLLVLVRDAGLPAPLTGAVVNGFKVDFFWPELGLVVETDGLRYHRTPAQQARDRERDQAHLRAGLTPLRFTHAQVRYEPDRVISTLRELAARLPRQAA